VRIDFDRAGITRAALMAGLREDGIGSQVHYIPVSSQPYYRERYGEAVFPGAKTYYRHTLSLPLFPAMEEDDVERVIDRLANRLGLS